METLYYQDRLLLHKLRRQHPQWRLSELAKAVGRSVSWVKKWLKRFRQTPPEATPDFHSQSRRPKTPHTLITEAAIQAVLLIRDNPPVNRIPGPKTIQYFLHHEPRYRAAGYLPRSTSTIWAILEANQRIDRPAAVDHEPLSLAEPLEKWQIDFKEISGIKAVLGDKQGHQVETLNIIDCGTSILIDSQVRTDYRAETVIDSLVGTFSVWGVPRILQFDRDPRFVGSWTANDFPSPFMQCLLCLGIELIICPPHRPDKNCYVERFNRTYGEEGLDIYLPETLDQVVDMNLDLKVYYNYRRPHQGLACGNQPPRLAFPDLPTLPQLPDQVEPDAWLRFVDGQVYRRRVNASGTVQLGKKDYYIGRHRKGQLVLLQPAAESRTLSVLLDGQSIKTVPIKGLVEAPMAWADFLPWIRAQAVSDWQRYRAKVRRVRA
jgi:transposase InsO family protein